MGRLINRVFFWGLMMSELSVAEKSSFEQFSEWAAKSNDVNSKDPKVALKLRELWACWREAEAAMKERAAKAVLSHCDEIGDFAGEPIAAVVRAL